MDYMRRSDFTRWTNSMTFLRRYIREGNLSNENAADGGGVVIATVDTVAALEPTFVVAGRKKVTNDNHPKIIAESLAISAGLLDICDRGGHGGRHRHPDG